MPSSGLRCKHFSEPFLKTTVASPFLTIMLPLLNVYYINIYVCVCVFFLHFQHIPYVILILL